MAKVFKRYDVTAVQREYESEGKMKKVRKQIGEMTIFQGDDQGYFYKMSLYANPGLELDLYEQKPKEEAKDF
jgi:hypothetical protein